MSDVAYPRVQTHLARLKLPRMAECLDALAQEAAKHDWTYVEFLDHLLDAEVSARYERDVAMKTKLAHFPFVKTLDQFDFAFQPAISERQIRELATLQLRRQRRERPVPGPARRRQDASGDRPGRGRHPAGHQRLLHHHGRPARTSCTAMPRRIASTIAWHTLCRPKLLIVDEMGYFPLDRMAAQFLFQLVSRRYQTRLDHPDLEQVLRRLGRHLRRPGPGGRHPGPAAALLDDDQHPRPELPAARETQGRRLHANSTEPAKEVLIHS